MKVLITITMLAAATMATAAAAQPPRPVLIGTNGPDLDACGSTGVVSGLNRRGDNFLSVRVAPGARARELDRLRTGQPLIICDDVGNGQWWGVIYSRNPNQDCRLGSAIRRPRPYPGPCRSGWVSGRYVTFLAG